MHIYAISIQINVISCGIGYLGNCELTFPNIQGDNISILTYYCIPTRNITEDQH